MALNSGRRGQVRRGLEELAKRINANPPARTAAAATMRIEVDPRLKAAMAKRRGDILRRKLAQPGDRTIVPCGLRLAAATS